MKNKGLIIGIVVVAIIVLLVSGYLYLNNSMLASKQLDLLKIQEEIPELKTNNVEFQMIYSSLSEEENLLPEDAQDIYLGTFEEKGIQEANFENAMGTINQEGKGYISFDNVIDVSQLDKEVKTFFEKYNVLDYKKVTVDKIVAYLNTNNNNVAEKKIKDSKAPVFSMLSSIDKNSFKEMYNINVEDLEEAVAANPVMMVNSNMYIVAKPVKGKKAEVKKEIEKYMVEYEKRWSTYLPNQHELVKNRLVKEYGEYIIYVISDDNEKVFNAIKDCKK